MASMLGLMEERETAARARVEDLREEAARAAAVLEAAEIELDRRVIAREELLEALAASAAETVTVTETSEAAGLVAAPVVVPGSTVPAWRDDLAVTVLAPDYQRILGVLESRQKSARAKDIALALGIEPTSSNVEGVRSKVKRLADRGWAVREASGLFSSKRSASLSPAAGSSA